MENTIKTQPLNQDLFVPETAFGFWFLGTKTWQKEVLKVAIRDLVGLIPEPVESYPIILDAGCGQGLSIPLLAETFDPQKIIALDYEQKALNSARQVSGGLKPEIQFLQSDCAEIPLPDASVDLVFCHQTFHHLVRQEQSLKEFFRVLKSGGILLFAESTKAYIHSWMIKLLFAHPMHLQRTAAEYLELIRNSGFSLDDKNVHYPYLWWSRSDLGLLELIGIKPKPFGSREETLVNLVARKP